MAAQFKERLDAHAVARIGAAITAVAPDFAAPKFSAAVVPGLAERELIARVEHIADGIAAHLLRPFPDAAAVLVAALGAPVPTEAPDVSLDDGPLRGFLVWPLTRFIARYGADHFDAAFGALREMTRRFTGEFAVRGFIEREPERAYALLGVWADDPDPHIRRLVSEGSRPRLPWGQRLRGAIADPSAGLALIERLKDDPSLYVRRSVANHLNDVSKDHPDRALAVAARWADGASPERAWVVRHALRTLLRAAHPEALAIIGLGRVDVQLEALDAEPRVAIGAKLAFALTLHNPSDDPAEVRIDYLMHHVKADGRTRPKVFQLGRLTLAPGERRRLERTHDFRVVSTRRYYPGEHRLEPRINGEVIGEASFTLHADDGGQS